MLSAFSSSMFLYDAIFYQFTYLFLWIQGSLETLLKWGLQVVWKMELQHYMNYSHHPAKCYWFLAKYYPVPTEHYKGHTPIWICCTYKTGLSYFIRPFTHALRLVFSMAYNISLTKIRNSELNFGWLTCDVYKRRVLIILENKRNSS